VLSLNDRIELGTTSSATVRLMFVRDATPTSGGGGEASEGVIRFSRAHADGTVPADAARVALEAEKRRVLARAVLTRPGPCPAPPSVDEEPTADGSTPLPGPSAGSGSDHEAAAPGGTVRAVMGRRFCDDFAVDEAELGRGAFASVFGCTRRSDGARFAVKKVSRTRLMLRAGRAGEDQLRQEAAVLLSCRHPNVLRVSAFYEERGFFHQVMELMRNGDLSQKISDKWVTADRRAAAAAAVAAAAGGGGGAALPPGGVGGMPDGTGGAPGPLSSPLGGPEPAPAPQDAVAPFSEEQSLQIFVQVCEGLRYLHDDARVAHRDIKPENVLLDKMERRAGGRDGFRWWFKLADGLFSQSNVIEGGSAAGGPAPVPLDGRMSSVAGTASFMAPEMVALLPAFASQAAAASQQDAAAAEPAAPGRDAKRGIVYGREVDLFSLGVTLHVLLSGQHPFMESGGSIPAQAVAQAKLAVRAALAREAQAGGSWREAADASGLAGAAVLAADDPDRLRSLGGNDQESGGGRTPQVPPGPYRGVTAADDGSTADLGPRTASSSSSSSSSPRRRPGPRDPLGSSEAFATTPASSSAPLTDTPSSAAPRSSRWTPSMRGPVWAGISHEAKHLVTMLLDPDPTQRPSAAACLDHAWTRAEARRQRPSARSRAAPFAQDISRVLTGLRATLADAEARGEDVAYALLSADHDAGPSRKRPAEDGATSADTAKRTRHGSDS